MNYLFFDTETTGTHSDARITQFAWQLRTETEIISQANDLIFPDGWEIPNEPFFTENGMTTERNQLRGIPIAIALTPFLEAMNEADFLVAHNLDFDFRILGYELKKLEIFDIIFPPKICTMKVSTDLCKLPGKYGYKWPRLEELHKFLFNSAFEKAHDAFSDVNACAKCFFEMKKRNVI